MIIVIVEKNNTSSANAIANKIQRERGLTWSNCIDYRENVDRGHFGTKAYKIRSEIIPTCNTPGGSESNPRLKHAIIVTGDPAVVQLFNYELLKNPGLHLEAYEALPATKNKPLSMRSAIKGGLIDISIVQYAINKFQKDYNKLLNKRRGKKK